MNRARGIYFFLRFQSSVDMQPAKEPAKEIYAMGFNAVRKKYSGWTLLYELFAFVDSIFSNANLDYCTFAYKVIY